MDHNALLRCTRIHWRPGFLRTTTFHIVYAKLSFAVQYRDGFLMRITIINEQGAAIYVAPELSIFVSFGHVRGHHLGHSRPDGRADRNPSTDCAPHVGSHECSDCKPHECPDCKSHECPYSGTHGRYFCDRRLHKIHTVHYRLHEHDGRSYDTLA